MVRFHREVLMYAGLYLKATGHAHKMAWQHLIRVSWRIFLRGWGMGGGGGGGRTAHMGCCRVVVGFY